MGDECTCEKCQAGSAAEAVFGAWPVAKAEAQADDFRPSQGSLYLVITDGGISLRQQSYEL
jgi:hypothetical protein